MPVFARVKHPISVKKSKKKSVLQRICNEAKKGRSGTFFGLSGYRRGLFRRPVLTGYAAGYLCMEKRREKAMFSQTG